jgi:signal transduction histidine kinase
MKSYFTFKNYRRVWLILIASLALTCLVPLSIITVTHQRIVDKAMNIERILRAERVTSNARRSVGNFLAERMDALKFIVNEVTYDNLSQNDQLETLLRNLKVVFGGISDLGVIKEDGTQVAYVGNFNLKGKNYRNEMWFKRCMENGKYISDVFKGFREVPHIILSIKSMSLKGEPFILRATLDTAKLIETVTSYQISEYADIFLINHEGVLQTPSSTYGDGDGQHKAQFTVPPFEPRTHAIEISDFRKERYVLGYAYILAGEMETPFILINLKQNAPMGTIWDQSKTQVLLIFYISVFVIMLIVYLSSTYMINRLYMSDSIKAHTLKAAEHKSQLASIGQLAAGVAHEINNPLAVINEEAGYMMDLISMGDVAPDKEELTEHMQSILDSVERCGSITRQLLFFARQFDVKIMSFHPADIISDVLKFFKKEAEYRNITLTVDVSPRTPIIVSDKGKFQQVFVNLINNAFQAMGDNGKLDIEMAPMDPDFVSVIVRDTGCGIPAENLSKIFDPFFTTKGEHEGTGLGLSITYGLMQKLKGKIDVKSKVGTGTTFKLIFPLNIGGVSKS